MSQSCSPALAEGTHQVPELCKDPCLHLVDEANLLVETWSVVSKGKFQTQQKSVSLSSLSCRHKWSSRFGLLQSISIKFSDLLSRQMHLKHTGSGGAVAANHTLDQGRWKLLYSGREKKILSSYHGDEHNSKPCWGSYTYWLLFNKSVMQTIRYLAVEQQDYKTTPVANLSRT